MTKNALVVDLDRCMGCRGCEVVCKQENSIDLGCTWNKVIEVGPEGTYPNVEHYFLPTMCQQCEDAPCVHVCPTGASYRGEDGVVLVDKSKCIGCKYCMMACPYGVRTWNEAESVVEKCTLCSHLTAAGEKPMCVRICATKARYYGDLEDPTSEAAIAIANAEPSAVHKLVDQGNEPVSTYILSHATWKSGE